MKRLVSLVRIAVNAARAKEVCALVPWPGIKRAEVERNAPVPDRRTLPESALSVRQKLFNKENPYLSVGLHT
jgi:hypothetical protein